VKYGERVEGKELKLRRPTGEWLPVLCNAAPIRDKEGNITGGIVAWRDITARKLDEEALRQSEIQARQQLEEIQSIYDLTPIGLCVLDRNLRNLRINRRLAELNGLPATDHIGKTVREILPDFASMAEEVADRIFETGHPVLDMEFSASTSSHPGMERTFIMHWLPLKDADGNIFGISFVSEEITERKLAVERLTKVKKSIVFCSRIWLRVLRSMNCNMTRKESPRIGAFWK
jgi:PAS domain S-box-containing protein